MSSLREIQDLEGIKVNVDISQNDKVSINFAVAILHLSMFSYKDVD